MISKSRRQVHLRRLISGTLGGQILAIATYPAITRLFTPESFGVFSIYLSVVSFASLLAGFGAETHVVRSTDDSEAWAIFRLACGQGLLVALLTTGLAAAYWLTFDARYPWVIVLLVGAGTALGAFSNVALYLGLRAERSSAVSTSRVTSVGVAAAFQLMFGWFGLLGAVWLILAHVIAKAISLGVLIPTVLHHRRMVTVATSLIRAARRHYGTLVLVGPGNLLAGAALQLPAVIIGATLGVASAGQFGLMARSVGVPMNVVGTAAAQSALIDSGSLLREGKRPREAARIAHRRTLRLLVPLGLTIGLVLAVWGPSLFALVFGAEWRDSGLFARLMAPAVVMQLTTSPSSQLVIVARDEGFWLLWNAARTILILGVLWGVGLTFGAAQSIAAFSSVQVALYIILQIRMHGYK